MGDMNKRAIKYLKGTPTSDFSEITTFWLLYSSSNIALNKFAKIIIGAIIINKIDTIRKELCREFNFSYFGSFMKYK